MHRAVRWVAFAAVVMLALLAAGALTGTWLDGLADQMGIEP